MIKALSLAAALAILPVSDAVADPHKGASEKAIEAAAEAFEARMEAFGTRAEAISEDVSLSEAERETRIAALWTEYQPDVSAFTAVVAEHASAVAANALAEIDVEALVGEALASVDASGAFAAASGIAANSAWTSNDPEHRVTYGLMADYALAGALDTLDTLEAGAATPAMEADEAPAASEASAPPEG
jgi:enamine deaminase RidA (YjgF/YER057c/UK114 family)